MAISVPLAFQVDLTDPITGLSPTSIPVAGRLTPPQIATAYSVPPGDGYGIKIGIISLNGGFLQSDLNKSFADLIAAGLLPPTTITPVINQVLLDGSTGTFNVNDQGSGENTVDIYCIATLVPKAKITLYSGLYFNTTIDRAVSDGCHIISISWATTESSSLETNLASAAAANIAVCVASGDWGSTFPGQTTVQVCYPSSSPHVISVGGTKLTLNTNNTRATEIDDNRDPSFPSTWGGGGGVSTIFSLPSWQSNLYYTPITNEVTGSPTALNARGLPDISAPMNPYALYFNGIVYGFGGTSLGTPVIAGILARIQQSTGVQRGSAAWNTIFYSNKGAFFDITVGSNNTGITSGYAGTVGWDAVTGLGAPTVTSIYSAIQHGETFPKQNHGFRSNGQAYPRHNIRF
jgi:kumamolisin